MKDLYYIRSHSNKLDLQLFYSNGHARHFPFGEKKRWKVNFPYKTDWLESNRQSLQNNKTMTSKNRKKFFRDSQKTSTFGNGSTRSSCPWIPAFGPDWEIFLPCQLSFSMSNHYHFKLIKNAKNLERMIHTNVKDRLNIKFLLMA